MRLATGSATVAMITAAGIVAPIALQAAYPHPELLAIATGAGSLIFSHVNDGGFWLVKEYFNMSVPQTIKTWSICETIISVTALRVDSGGGVCVVKQERRRCAAFDAFFKKAGMTKRIADTISRRSFVGGAAAVAVTRGLAASAFPRAARGSAGPRLAYVGTYTGAAGTRRQRRGN